jgi:hypothetical protein
MDDYSEYEKVEKHMNYSRSFHSLNHTGWRLLKEMEVKKNINGRKKMLGSVNNIHHLITNIVKPKSLCNNLYSSLLFYLDELLFMDVLMINTFVIEDDVFPLSYVYFNTIDWIHEDYDEFVLDKGITINDTEAHLLNCFIDNYEQFILTVQEDILKSEYYKTKDSLLVRKLKRIINRLKKRLIVLRAVVLRIIYKRLLKEHSSS